ncbi:MAG: hypothetical protein ABIJ09_00235 [Pseudomonadota bacterium]
MRRAIFVVSNALLILGLVGCIYPKRNLESRLCETDEDCIEGYRCDLAAKICVDKGTPRDAGPGERSVVDGPARDGSAGPDQAPGDAVSEDVPVSVCGDSTISGLELCDGTMFGVRTCQSEGFAGGDLVCVNCDTLDTSGCFHLPDCGTSCTDAASVDAEAADAAAVDADPAETGAGDVPGGADSGDSLCLGVVCDVAPGSSCSGTVLTQYAAPGTCVDGSCHYSSSTSDCGGPCATDHCVVCGDGDPETGEECDTGSEDSATCDYAGGSGAEACTLARCGDGYLNTAAGEVCDEGEADSSGCDYAGGSDPQSCTPVECGDGYVNSSLAEECEDANLTNGDGCSSTCGIEFGYECQGRPSVCTPVCGDGNRVGSEVCDDNYKDVCGSCNADCSAAGQGAVCGDGVVCPEFEVCDDSNTLACGTCSVDCLTTQAGGDCLAGDGCVSAVDCASNTCTSNQCQ